MMRMARKRSNRTNPGVLGANVASLRTRLGYTQTALAARAILSRSTIASIEGGKYKGSDGSTLLALAAALGTTVDDLTKAKPDGDQTPPLVAAYFASEWAVAQKPTSAEKDWLCTLPPITWVGIRPTAETVARIIQWRRDNGES